MSKKTVITSILNKHGHNDFAAVCFRLGATPIKADGQPCVNEAGEPLFPPVSEIKHCRDRFGAGAMVNIPCYVISFEDSPEQVIIPANEFAQITLMVVDKEEKSEVPNLPE